MERLALCSKILYDRDILEKQKHINELEKRLEIPKVRFDTCKEWEDFKERMYNDLHIVLKEWIEDNEFEYHHMSHLGITFRQEGVIRECIYKHLYQCTKNSTWSEKVAGDVVYSLITMINSLQDVHMWSFIRESFSPRDITELIYKHITWYLDDGSHSPCVLEDLPEFKCKRCHKFGDYIDDENLCFSCINM